MEFSCKKGDHIFLTKHGGTIFEGDVKTLNKELGRISLENVIQHPGNIKCEGNRFFDSNEIAEITSLDGSENSNDSKTEKQDEFDTSETQLTDSECIKIKKLQNEYRYIKNLGTNFHGAIEALRKCDKIGILAKDVSKGRMKRASVLAASTESNIFIFDLQVLGDAAFDNGLRSILESQKVVKVVHDTRLMSDCLRHKHVTNMENVRDVEAEDVMVLFQERGTIRKHSRSLKYLVQVYLNAVQFDDDYVINDVNKFWNERPLDLKLQKSLAASVSFLLPLQKAIERKYLERLTEASNLYNSFTKNSDLFDIIMNGSECTLRKQLIELVVPKKYVRSTCESTPNTTSS